MAKAAVPGVPPTCPTCSRRLRPYKFYAHPVIDPLKVSRWGYEGNNIFCTLRCGFNWGLVFLRERRRRVDRGTP